MQFLYNQRKTPRDIDLTYESYTMQEKKTTTTPDQLMKEAITKSRVASTLKDIFVLHGAIDLDIPILSPASDSSTIFLNVS